MAQMASLAILNLNSYFIFNINYVNCDSYRFLGHLDIYSTISHSSDIMYRVNAYTPFYLFIENI